jgi:hypothetical protein
MKLMLSEIIQKVHGAKTKAKKIELLQQYNSQVLRSLFIVNFDESVQTRIPEGDVPYRKNDSPKGTEHTLLEHEGKKLYYFVKGGADQVPNLKIESMFIQMLEGLHEEEAELLVDVFNRRLHKKYRITKAVVSEAFPSIQWGNRS